MTLCKVNRANVGAQWNRLLTQKNACVKVGTALAARHGKTQYLESVFGG